MFRKGNFEQQNLLKRCIDIAGFKSRRYKRLWAVPECKLPARDVLMHS